VLAFDVRNGRRLWTFPLGMNSSVTGIARWHDLVFVTDVLDHAIFAVDAATGTEVWTQSFGAATTGPTVIGDLLLFEGFGQLRAVRPATGATVWTATSLVGLTSSFPALADGVLYVGTDTGKLYAIDLSTGTVLWSVQGKGGVRGSIVVHRGVAYWGTQGTAVFAVDIATHSKLWNATVGDQPTENPSVAHGLVYLNSDDGSVYALHARTGSLAWTVRTGSGASPTIANGVLYAPGLDGHVQAFGASTGELLCSFGPPGVGPWKVAVADGSVYFGTDVRVFAMRVPPGP